MKKEDLLAFLQDVVEQDSDLGTLKYRYTVHGYGVYDLNVLKKIAIYGIQQNILEFSEYVREEQKYIDIDLEKAIDVIEKDCSWENTDDKDYNLIFVDIPKYFFILFGPYGPVGEHAFEGARIPEEFEQFIID